MSAIATSPIVSQAFRLMEMQPISSFGDESEQAMAAAEQYPVALDACLEACDWTFASQPAQLPMVNEVSGDPRLQFVYQRPGDLVRLLEVHPEDTLWRLDADRLRADQPAPLFIRYTRRVTDETKLPALFQLAVSYRLAALLAPRWTASINRAQGLSDQSDMHLERAKIADRRGASAHRYDGRPRQGDWVDVAQQRILPSLRVSW